MRKKRNSQSTSGPLKATEDAIKPSTETKEREEDVGPEESKPVEIEMKAATTATTEVLENHRDETRTTNNLYEADTEHARRGRLQTKISSIYICLYILSKEWH